MATNEEFQFRKLNDLLCTSFNNVKHDVRDMHGMIDNLSTNFASFTTESIKTAFEEQSRLILEQQRALNQLGERLNELETRKPEVVREIRQVSVPQVSTVFKNKESALTEVRKMLKEDAREKEAAEKSLYDIPEGEARITKTQFKSTAKGKRKLNSEWVEVTGYGVDMTGFKLHDKDRKHTFTFPNGFKIYGPVKIMTGKGKNTNTKLYWKSPRLVWNDTGDVATLRDKRNKAVSQVLSEPTYSFKTLR
jgi:hypothetical protein